MSNVPLPVRRAAVAPGTAERHRAFTAQVVTARSMAGAAAGTTEGLG